MARQRPFPRKCLTQHCSANPQQPTHVYAEAKSLTSFLQAHLGRPQHVRLTREEMEALVCDFQQGLQSLAKFCHWCRAW